MGVELAVIIGLLGVALCFLWLAVHFDKKNGDPWYLAYELLFFGAGLLLMVGVAFFAHEFMSDAVTCEVVVNQTYEIYEYGDNYSGYHWEYDSPEPECNAANPTDCVNLFHRNTSYTYMEECYSNPAGNNATRASFIVTLGIVLTTFFFFIIQGIQRTANEGVKTGKRWLR